jgi:hypothetical protein
VAAGDSQNLNQIKPALLGFFLQVEELQSGKIQDFGTEPALLPWLQERPNQPSRYSDLYAGKTQLDWKKVRANHLYADTFFALVNYVTEGPKTEAFPFYCKIQHIE